MHTSDHPARRSTAAALVITALFVLTQLYSAIPLIGPVSTDLGGNATFTLSTSFSLCYALGFLIWGPIADHYGRRACLLTGIALLTVATLSCAVTTSLGSLAVARCIQGITAASFAPIALAYLSDSTPPAWRGTAIGAMSTAFLVAGIFGQVTAQAITERWGWHWVFGASALILFICAGAIAVLMRDRTTRTPYSSLIDQFTRVGALLTTPTILLLCSAHVTLLLVFVAMYTALGPHLVTLGYSPSDILILRLVGLPGMFAALAVGKLSQRFSTITLARAGFILGAVGLILEACMHTSITGIGAASLVCVTGVAVAVATMITLFGQVAAPNRATGMAINGLVLFLGASIGPLLGAAGLSFSALLLVLAALYCCAALSLTVVAKLL
ncbi:MFS transporter [Corynebacterium durum]|uniref:MFS transporter n=1 Tax=Corynebacterium durum TaxID=61592 RepID=UPI0015CDA0C3|nr:MFS transporter [Corynebacterium durum]NYI74584.1 MFS family permease [Corynebacterium durum]WJY86300.1 Multidrug resistance protein 3 [Corynebacterium durum]